MIIPRSRLSATADSTKITTTTDGDSEHSNTILPVDRPIHDWYRFVLSFPPHLVRKYIQAFGLTSEHTVLDPFCGTGTTLVECRKERVHSFGVEAHPMAYLASRVKTNWSLDTALLSRLLKKICQSIACEIVTEGLPLLSLQLRMTCETRAQYRIPIELSDDEERLIPEGFVSPKPLRRLLAVRRCVETHTNLYDQDVRDFFFLALAHCIVNGAGNFAFGPEIYRVKPKDDYDVEGHFARQAQLMLYELKKAQRELAPFAECAVVQGDARTLDTVPDGGADALITSPPYPNEKDYTRTTRVESVLLRLVTSRRDLRAVKSLLLRSNTRNVFVDDNDEEWVKDCPEIRRICERIEQRRTELNKTSGFERLYYKVVGHYFGGMARHFTALCSKIKRGAKCAYVVGDQLSFLMVPVPTAKLLGVIAERHGFRQIGCDLWRSRFGTKSKTYVREEILLLERR